MVMGLLIGLIIGAVIGGITIGIIIYKYKKKLKSPIYPLDKFTTLDLNPFACSDNFLRRSVTKVRINTGNKKR